MQDAVIDGFWIMIFLRGDDAQLFSPPDFTKSGAIWHSYYSLVLTDICPPVHAAGSPSLSQAGIYHCRLSQAGRELCAAAAAARPATTAAVRRASALRRGSARTAAPEAVASAVAAAAGTARRQEDRRMEDASTNETGSVSTAGREEENITEAADLRDRWCVEEEMLSFLHRGVALECVECSSSFQHDADQFALQ